MAAIRTINLLPQAFRSDTNQKFLNATLDQLVSQPDLRKVNAYIGRKFAPTFKSTDNYQPEPTTQRQNYQLEPSVVVKDTNGTVNFFSSYIDLLNQIEYNGGITTDHSRLFAGESYSFDGLFDFDKFVNFNQYYWLPNGPDAVQITGAGIPAEHTYTVIRDTATGTYRFSGEGIVENPTLRLAHGGKYTFIVDQPGYPFWIQSEPGVSGVKANQGTFSSRNILGVSNNGTDVGSVTFTVPQVTAQDFYILMPTVTNVDVGIQLHYSQVHNQTIGSIKALGGLDGINSQYIGKTLIFTNTDIDDSLWTVPSNVDINQQVIDPTLVVPVSQRRNAWAIRLADPLANPTDNNTVVVLESIVDVAYNEKTFVRSGATSAGQAFYLNSDTNTYTQVPDITAPLATMYYQDGVSAGAVGAMNLLAVTDTTINVDQEIIGRKNYQSPNGVKFTNGLKVTFESSALPRTYANNTYYVEGVGSNIILVDVNTLQTPESYANNGIATQDYITINRAGQDLNPWTRSNRWFHIDIITQTAGYNGVVPIYNQLARANRPVIEFNPDIQLFNFGRVAKAPVDIFSNDGTITDARNQIELAETYTVNGVLLDDGMRIVFADDIDPTVKNQIFIVTLESINGQSAITLVPAEDSQIDPNNNLVVLQGTNKGLEYYFNGTDWTQGQQKTAVNQSPLFDVIDLNGNSFSDTAVYPASTFAGTKIFSYQIGNGTPDSVLGFPLSYRNFNQIGDIQFNNNFDSDTFTYTGNKLNVNQGVLQQNTSLTEYKIRNIWITNTEQSKQFQIIAGVYDGNNPFFEIDITPNSEQTVPYFRVYINSKEITSSYYAVRVFGEKTYVQITTPTLTTGDQIDILIYSDSVSALGYYEIPKNLDFNTENKNFTSLTLGQLRNHLSTMAGNSNQLTGVVPGSSNLRDVPIKPNGGSIVQHASPVIYSELFLVDQNANFMKAVNLAQHEYSKIKNKLLELSQSLSGVDITNIPGTLDLILKTINSVKNKTFSWYYSDMVPYSDIKNTITYTVLNTEIVDYEIANVFDPAALSNRAVLVYLNGKQLIRDIDYTFDTTHPGITISHTLAINDTIVINDYSNTDGNYIPETPTKLGLYPKFTPSMFVDNTYVTPTLVIQGHDGSITPAFGDFRDDLLLEFETRIYNNIKINYNKNVFDIYNFLPGKYRNTAYSNNEFTQLLTKSFLEWVGNNRVDYITNLYYDAANPFTWNYGRFKDTVDGELLPGAWRAIYKYFYDTDRPHTSPWEMLGFSEMPSWWSSRYGPAPYTGGNQVLWNDLEQGYIYGGNRAGYDPRFTRPGLSKIIPVDANGNLRSPDQILASSYNVLQATGSYSVGQQGPVETAWRRSSEFPFAMQQALALSHPAFYFGSLMNVGTYYKNTDLNQYVNTEYNQRIRPIDIDINGVVDEDDLLEDGTVELARAAGYINWIAEYLRNIGIDPSVNLNNLISNANVQLAYKMAGYSDKSLLQVLAEQSSPTSTTSGVVIPNENYTIDLYKSTPTSTITYSSVIVEASANGYTVSGYDTNNPYFTIIPSLANNNSYAITVLKATGVVYNDFQKYKVTVPYGFEFNNIQQVVDFLVSYERYLRAVGISFTDFDTDLNLQRDFKLSVREFLMWVQQGWAPGSLIVLGPILNRLVINTQSGVIDQVLNQPNSSRLLDTNFNYIKNNQFSVTRDNNRFSITANYGQTIGLASLAVVEYEHVLIFDNTTVFNDIIYKPELGNRQYRLKLVGSKTGSWTGNMNPPGFIYNSPQIATWEPGTDYAKGSLVMYKSFYYAALSNLVATSDFNTTMWRRLPTSEIKTGLLPNFTYNAGKFKQFNDLDNPELQGQFSEYSDSAIGFWPRQYLTDFGINNITQAKFYQGFIKEKGTLNSVTAFTAAGFNNISSNISIYEEWGMRVGEYGSLTNNKFVEVTLIEGTFNSDPITFTLLPNNGVTTDKVIGIQPAQLYKYSDGYVPEIYPNRNASSIYENDIQTAGYVNVNDVDTTIFDISNYATLNSGLANVNIGYTVWAAKDTHSNWNVYRVTETNFTVTTFTNGVDNVATVTVKQAHNFVYGDFVVIKGFDVRVDGFYQIYNVVDAYNFNVVIYQSQDQLNSVGTITGSGPIYHLQSSRLTQPTDINSITPLNGWMDNDKLWVDNNGDGSWTVYNKSTPWTGNVSVFNPAMQLHANTYSANSGFGTAVAINSAGTFSAAGQPNVNAGNVLVFVSNITNGNVLTQVGNLGSTHGTVSKFGASLDTAGNLLYIGNPGNGSTESGCVHIHKFDGNISFPWSQTLSSPSLSNVGDLFGTSISASADGDWLFVGAPNAGNVYVYQANVGNFYHYANTITVGSSAAAKFGYTVKTTSDASQTIVSAPYESVNGVVAAGSVYVYDRSIESFIADGGTTFVTQYPTATNPANVKITVNGEVLTSGYSVFGNTSVIFDNAPVIGSFINVDTNKIKFMEKLISPQPTSGGAFGITAYISGNDADIYVASPGYSEPGYHSGVVYRFVNQGASYGTITGTTNTPTVNSGDSIRVNGILVTWAGTTVANVASAINSANIVGVTANVQDFGALTITSNVQVPYEKLVLTPGSGTALSDLGLNVYANVQSIKHPQTDLVDQFGSQIVSSDDGTTLVISASHGSSLSVDTFDTDSTEFDTGSTMYFDGVEGSGMIYVYGLVGEALSGTAKDQYVLSQRLSNSNLSANDQFGSSLAANQTTLLVGAPGDSNNIGFDPVSEANVYITNSGRVYTYNNFTGNVGWDVITKEAPKVDIDSVSRFFMYNTITNTILTNLDHYDPAKGKILGVAAEDLDFVTAYDPAIYNAAGGSDTSAVDVSVNVDYHWGSRQVGMTWWNLNQVRYIDYEQGNVTYRSANWGKTFPGSKIQVLEWVESSVPPSQYKGEGTPLYTNDSAYSTESYIDSNTNMVRGNYYFWVSDKTSVDINSARINSISTIQDIIQHPESQGIPYAEVLRNDTISLRGITDMITGNSVVLHVDYDVSKNTNVIHSEYQLVQEGNSGSVIPARIINKMADSLAGKDAYGNAIPNPALAIQNRLGLDALQTVFENRLTAVKNFVEYVNSILINVPIIEEFNINGLYATEPYPDYTTYDIKVATHVELSYIDTNLVSAGYLVLVEADETQLGLWATYEWAGTEWLVQQTQSYNVPTYWSKVDWYDSTYDPTVKPDYVVDTLADLKTLSFSAGKVVKVLNNGNGHFIVYRYTSSTAKDVVGIQNGTVQFSNSLYSSTVDAAAEIRIIFETLQNNIFINTLKSNFNSLFFFLINYILTEQPSVDWVFKTSFISVLHQLRKLEQFPNYIQDNQTYYEQYINEVKPYRTSIREYLLDYQGSDEYYGDVTDFDIPSSYNSTIKSYHSPDGSLQTDAYQLAHLPQYTEWYNNHTYSISSVIVSNAGQNYYSTPTLTITGGGGTGAVLQAVVDFTSNSIMAVDVINPGSGYTSTPTISINGTGTGAILYPKLNNQYFIESLPTQQLTANTDVTVYVGNVITQPNTGAVGTVYTTTTGNLITVVDVVGTFATGEYIFSDAANLTTTVTAINSYTQFVNQSYNNVRTFDSNIKFDRVSYTTSVIDWQPNITVTAGMVVSYNSQAYEATVDVYSETTLNLSGNLTANIGDYLTQTNASGNAQIITISANLNLVTVANITGEYQRRGGNVIVNGTESNVRPVAITNVFDYGSYSKLSADSFDNANDRIWAFYQPTVNMPDKDLKKLVAGIEYPGVFVEGVEYTGNVSYIDSYISSSYTDSALGTRPEDINIDGGKYYDTYSSHAPEELIPGVIYDNLNMSVYTQDNLQTIGYRITQNMRANSWATGYTTAGNVEYRVWPEYYTIDPKHISVLTANLHLTDGNIFVANSAVFMTPDLAQNQPGIIYINGEKITYWVNDTANNKLGQIRRAVDGTGAPQVHASGLSVVEANLTELIPGGNVVHRTTWLNVTNTSTLKFIVDNAANDLVDNLGDAVIVPGVDELLLLQVSGNVTVAKDDVITQPSTGASAVVQAASIGSVITVWYANTVGQFGQTVGNITANTYVYNNSANLHVSVSSVAYNVTDGLGLFGSLTSQAQFIKAAV